MKVLVCMIGMATLALTEAVSQPPVIPVVVKGEYFGQRPPGKTPELFAPGIISQTNRLVDHVAFSPDGNECFFTIWGPNFSSAKIFWTKRVGNTWTPQEEAPFSAGHYAATASFSMDGNKLYFSYSKHELTDLWTVSYTHLRAHETDSYLVCRLL